MTDGHNTSTPPPPLLVGGRISCEREAKNYVKILTFQNSTHLHSGPGVHMPDVTIKFQPQRGVDDQWLATTRTLSSFVTYFETSVALLIQIFLTFLVHAYSHSHLIARQAKQEICASSVSTYNKLASLEGALVQNYDRPTHLLSGADTF